MPRRLLDYLVAAMLVVWTALAVLSPAFATEPVFPPGSRIGLELPGDLKPSTQFPGFADIDRKVAIADGHRIIFVCAQGIPSHIICRRGIVFPDDQNRGRKN